jgi:hypothetical protein
MKPLLSFKIDPTWFCDKPLLEVKCMNAGFLNCVNPFTQASSRHKKRTDLIHAFRGWNCTGYDRYIKNIRM